MIQSRIFLDTNIWLRYFVKNDPDQYEAVLNLISRVEQGKFKVYTSSAVLMEINYVGQRIYQIPKDQIIIWFKAIQKMRSMVLVEKTNFELALSFYQKYNIKLADCLIASQLPKNTVLVSFDEEFSKLREIIVKSPKQVLSLNSG